MFFPKPEDDCDECVPDYLRKASLFHTAVSLFPFTVTFVIVGSLALFKLFPKFSNPGGNSSSATGKDTPKKTTRIWRRPKVQIISAFTFSLTIALSAVLTELLLCEISNSFDATARKTALNLALPSLLLLLIFILPLLELYSIISSAGWRFRGEGVKFRFAWVLELFGFGVFALAFWTIGGLLPDHTASLDAIRLASEHTLVEGSLERLGLAGVTLMAALSGFAAVSAIWQSFGAKRSLVSDADVARKVSGLEATHELLESKKERRRALRLKLSEAPEQSLWSRAVGTLRPSTDSQELKSLDMEITGLETMVDSLEISLSALRSRHANQIRSQTALGRLWNTFQYVFSCYCVYRIVTTLVNFVRRRVNGNTTSTATDPVTMFIALFAKHINPAMNQTMWAHHISFLLSGVILMTSFSAVVQTINLFSRITPRNFIHIARANASLVIAQTCGTYVISSALMLRGTMPSDVKNVINDALGSGALDAGWVQKWFDMFFLGAVILTAQGLWISRKVNNDAWDDETWDTDVEMGKRL
ncbi:putative g protein-coupled receptor [Phaeomoniella chlamydospora]|uniref:Putative g protein-coupled receptor n=1 Tax=Phaeomoniella chlamydospora TaxID=158046 RepID=A0A0G2DX46_PHACM|nr:putative g protein-coupled receptor [Phaeomoniella chlamydospora]